MPSRRARPPAKFQTPVFCSAVVLVVGAPVSRAVARQRPICACVSRRLFVGRPSASCVGVRAISRITRRPIAISWLVPSADSRECENWSCEHHHGKGEASQQDRSRPRPCHGTAPWESEGRPDEANGEEEHGGRVSPIAGCAQGGAEVGAGQNGGELDDRGKGRRS